MRIPKRLDISRSCFYQLPDDTPTKDLTDYEIMFRKLYAGVFKIRSRSSFFFELPNTRKRNDFLLSLEDSARQSGLIVQRETMY